MHVHKHISEKSASKSNIQLEVATSALGKAGEIITQDCKRLPALVTGKSKCECYSVLLYSLQQHKITEWLNRMQRL